VRLPTGQHEGIRLTPLIEAFQPPESRSNQKNASQQVLEWNLAANETNGAISVFLHASSPHHSTSRQSEGRGVCKISAFKGGENPEEHGA